MTNKPGTDRSATDPGPTNQDLDSQNRDSAWPPGTDSKSLIPTFQDVEPSIAGENLTNQLMSARVVPQVCGESKDLVPLCCEFAGRASILPSWK